MTLTIEQDRPFWLALKRGFAQKCPECGEGNLFRKYLKTDHVCTHCQLDFDHHRADDAPPYFTIFIVGHLVIPGTLLMEKMWAPPEWLHLSIWLPFTLISCLWLLPRAKGTLISLQWAKRMHGFGGEFD
jgi:uncharacterized protein (DUF983 family)